MPKINFKELQGHQKSFIQKFQWKHLLWAEKLTSIVILKLQNGFSNISRLKLLMYGTQTFVYLALPNGRRRPIDLHIRK